MNDEEEQFFDTQPVAIEFADASRTVVVSYVRRDVFQKVCDALDFFAGGEHAGKDASDSGGGVLGAAAAARRLVRDSDLRIADADA